MSIRVLHLIDTLALGGAQSILRDLCASPVMDRCGIRNRIIALHRDSAAAAFADRQDFDVDFLAAHRRQLLTIGGRLWRALRNEAFDVVHCHLSASTLIGAPLARIASGRPCVVGVYAARRQISALHYRALFRWTAPVVDRYVVVVAEWGAELRSLGIAPEKVTNIPLGLDLRPAVAIDRHSARCRVAADIGVDAGRPLISLVARLSPDRKTLAMVEAMPKILLRNPDAVLVVVGEGADRARATGFVREHGLADSVFLVGERADPWPYYAAADVFLAEIHHGVSGVAPLQAMACATPVVGLSQTPLPAPIVRFRNRGILDAAADTDALATAIGQLLADPAAARAVGEAARTSVHTESSIEAMASSYADLYRQLAPAA